MRMMGVIEGISADKRAVVLCSEAPDIGDEVLDGGKRRVGRVYKVFGPVEEPYASVTVNDGIRLLAGTKLYVNGGSPNGKAKRRNRRSQSLS